MTAEMTAKTCDNTDNRDNSYSKSSYYRRKRELFNGFYAIRHRVGIIIIKIFKAFCVYLQKAFVIDI